MCFFWEFQFLSIVKREEKWRKKGTCEWIVLCWIVKMLINGFFYLLYCMRLYDDIHIAWGVELWQQFAWVFSLNNKHDHWHSIIVNNMMKLFIILINHLAWMEINNFHFIPIILHYFMIIIYNTSELISNHQIQDHRLFQQRNLHQNFQNHDSFLFYTPKSKRITILMSEKEIFNFLQRTTF